MERVLRPPGRSPADARVGRVRRRGALPVPGVGARRCRFRAPRFDGAADVDALVEAFHDDARARLRGQGARAAGRVPVLEGPRASALCRSRRSPRLPRTAPDAATAPRQTWWGATSPPTRRSIRARRSSAAAAGRAARRSSRCRRRRSSSIRAGLRRVTERGRLPARARNAAGAKGAPSVSTDRGSDVRSDPACGARATGFDGICREMTNTLLRSARSAVINMARDFSCSLVTADNELLASAEGLPVHVIGSEFLAEAMTRASRRPRRGRRLPPQRPVPRQHPLRRPRDPRAGLLRRRARVHGRRQGTPGRLRQRAADHLRAVRAGHLRGGGDQSSRASASSATTTTSTTSSGCASAGSASRSSGTATSWPDSAPRGSPSGVCKELLRAVRPATSVAQFIERVVRLQRAAHGAGDQASCRPARSRAARRTIPIRVCPDGDPAQGRRCEIDAEEGRVELDLRDNPDNYPGGLNESRACATGKRDDRPLQLDRSRTCRTTPGSFRRVTVLLREGCIAGIPRFPHSCSMATTNVADRLVCLTQSAFAELGRGTGSPRAAMGMPPYMAVISGLDHRPATRPTSTRCSSAPAAARAARPPTAGRPT